MKSEKEQAQELVDKFRTEIYKDEITTADFNPERNRIRTEKSKQCALICVDVIITELDRNCAPKYQLTYWRKVKTEIYKIS